MEMISRQIDLAHRILSSDLQRKSPTVYGIPVSYEILAERAVLERIVVLSRSSKRAFGLALVGIIATAVGPPERVVAFVHFA